MDVPSPAEESAQARTSLSPKKNSTHENPFPGSEHILAGSSSADIGQSKSSIEDARNAESKFEGDLHPVAMKNSNRLTHKEKKVGLKFGSRKYTLRSSLDGVRVLRSMSRRTSMTPPDSSTVSVHLSNERRKTRKKRKKIKNASNDEFVVTRKRVRYLLARMDYEQNLIDAYSGEGWKGQSLEKIRPEKELQRAASEILRCKLKIRDIFQHLGDLTAEGRHQESLFDSEGKISSEDIFCAKCKSNDLSADNDIILCDGACDRGFHQKCLDPPLLKIPPGDDSWLCPGCDCKIDCIDLLNDLQGTDLSIEDNWEKVFPEAASVAAGDKQYDDFGFPSDDSEDNDYDPDGPEVVEKEVSSSEESDFTAASDDSRDSPHDERDQDIGFTSDDMEDNACDPNGPGIDEIHVSSLPNCSGPVVSPGKGRSRMTRKKNGTVNSEFLSILEQDLSETNALLVSGKRHREQLDYKKLHDETYGDLPSDSSDDEDWTEMNKPKKENNDIGKTNVISSKRNDQITKKGKYCKTPQSKLQRKNILPESNLDQFQVCPEETKNTGKRRTRQKLEFEVNPSVAKPCEGSLGPDFIGNKGTKSGSRSYGGAISQKLVESWRENMYPTRETKENLSKDLGITLRQVNKWFENARRSLRHSANDEAGKQKIGTPSNRTNTN